MAQEGWEDLPREQQAEPTKGVPRWLLFCGCGCLLAILAVGGALGFFFFYAKRLVDAEHQLPHLARIVPFDEPLEGLDFVFRVPLGVDAFILQDPTTDGGYVLMFTHVADTERASQAREQALDPTDRTLAGVGGRREQVEPLELAVQGRSLAGVRFLVPGGGEPTPQLPPGFPKALVDPSGAAVLLDVTPPGTPGVVLLQVFRAAGGDEPIPAEYLVRVLEPFHIGPDR